MSYTQEYCDYWRDYRKRMLEAANEYNKALKALEMAKGSELYNTEKAKLDAAYTEKTNAIKRQLGACFSLVFNVMRKNANQKPADIPTAEQLNLLSALKMREKVSREEFRSAANAMRGNRTAMATLADIAAHHGYNSLSAEVEPLATSALSKIDTLQKTTERLLSLPRLGVNPSDRIHAYRMGDIGVRPSDNCLDRDYSDNTEILNAMMFEWGNGRNDMTWFENAVN